MPLKNNRMKINLFDTSFVTKFEAIYGVIDQRIIQLLSSNKGSAQKENVRQNGLRQPQLQQRANPNEKIKELMENNENLKREMQRMKNKNDDLLSEKVSEMHGLRQQMN